MPGLPFRLAIVTAFPRDPATPHGGVESVSVNLVDALAAFDEIDVHVVTTDSSRDRQEEYGWKRATIHRLPRQGGRVLLDAVGPGRRQVQSFLGKLAPAVVHSHDVYGIMVKRLPMPRVHTIHGFIHGDTLVSDERFAWLRSQVWRRVEEASWADHPHIVSISPYVRERLSGVATGVIHDIENPISPECFGIRRNEGPLTIFSAGLVCRRKNTLNLVEAFARLVAAGIDVRLRLAGAVIEPAYDRAVRERVSAHRLEDRVEWLGGLRIDAVRQELSKASVFALVSREENAPLGIEESMASGLPVVTSNRCGMPYMVSHGETGFLVDPERPEDIARRLSEILCDPVRRAAMGEKARAVAAARFHPAMVATRTRDVYLEAMGRA